jgi:hypothetical protein
MSTVKRTYLELVEVVILPLLKQKALAKDMSLLFAGSLEDLNIRMHM